jgi:hypothetical protein
VTQVQGRDQALDRSALARGVPALQQRADRGAEPVLAQLAAEVEPQLGEPVFGGAETLLVLVLVEPELEVELVEAPDGADATPTGRRRRLFTRSSALSAAAHASRN